MYGISTYIGDPLGLGCFQRVIFLPSFLPSFRQRLRSRTLRSVPPVVGPEAGQVAALRPG